MKTLALALGAALVATLAVAAAPAAVQRTIHQRIDATAGQEVIVARAEIPPGTDSGRHTHAGVDAGWVISGRMTLKVDGQPDRQLGPGDTFAVPRGVVHHALTGAEPVVIAATYVVDKGQPLSTPAP